MTLEEGPLPAPASLCLVEEISHRVVNEYAEAISSLRLAAALVAGAPARDALRSAADRLRAQAEAHRALLPPARGLVNLADHVGRFCALLATSTFSARGVRFAVEAEEIWLSDDRAWRLTLILAELVRNAARHGLAGGSGAILVRVARDAGQIHCLVCDNGGAPCDPIPGRGSRLTHVLAAELGGTVEWTFLPGGCLARLQIPEGPSIASC
ncbi:sensor histidine kinase [Phenylobacterium sp.]|uniref:sensor histidine kinase n=1 Tax=Phenylobacterium sp. TaxID=1871053 RepID=UPI00286C5268|nr:sensor histidine kinase [Phenylobacterium sp.]